MSESKTVGHLNYTPRDFGLAEQSGRPIVCVQGLGFVGAAVHLLEKALVQNSLGCGFVVCCLCLAQAARRGEVVFAVCFFTWWTYALLD